MWEAHYRASLSRLDREELEIESSMMIMILEELD
jgi:hypothetical protein